MPQPLVSIICPLYNKLAYVEETINSVLDQSYVNWEMIIVDDGSTDGSFGVVEKFISNKIKLYKREDYKGDKGASVCRNIGIHLAKGKFVIFLDADDLLLPECLKDRVSLAQKYPGTHLYVFNHALFYDVPHRSFQQKVHSLFHTAGFYLSRDKELWMLSRFLTYDLPWTITNGFWKIETLRMVGGFDEDFQRFQDPEIHTRILLHKCTVRCLKYTRKPDVLIRIDKKRHNGTLGGQKAKFSIYIDSVELYLTKFYVELKKTGRNHLLKKLNGYLFSAEANINYLLKDCKAEDNVFYESKRVEVMNLRTSLEMKKDFLYDLSINLHSAAVKSDIGNRIKLPALIYKLYMFIN